MITKGNKVSPEMREVFKNLPVGTPVYFNNFLQRTSGAMKRLADMKLTIN